MGFGAVRAQALEMAARQPTAAAATAAAAAVQAAATEAAEAAAAQFLGRRERFGRPGKRRAHERAPAAAAFSRMTIASSAAAARRQQKAKAKKEKAKKRLSGKEGSPHELDFLLQELRALLPTAAQLGACAVVRGAWVLLILL